MGQPLTVAGRFPAISHTVRQWLELGVGPELSGSARRCQFITNATPALVLLMVMFYFPIFLGMGNWTLAMSCVWQAPIPLIGIAWFRWRQRCGKSPHYWKACVICQATTLVGITGGQGTLLGTHFYFLLFFLTAPLIVPVSDQRGMAITCIVCLAWFTLLHYFPWPAAPQVQALPPLILKALNLTVLLSGSAILFVALLGSELFSDVLENRIQQMAATDLLTGLGNRRRFYSALAQLQARFEREQRPFCLAMLDLDFFKRINDSRGHDVGDEVLRHVSALLRDNVRAEDQVCRIGGEEFAILFADTTATQAFAACEAIRQAIAHSPANAGGQAVSVTASLGVAAWSASHNAQSFLAAADRALYSAKRAGRNRVKRHKESETSLGTA